jgi:hypothetical protein
MKVAIRLGSHLVDEIAIGQRAAVCPFPRTQWLNDQKEMIVFHQGW